MFGLLVDGLALGLWTAMAIMSSYTGAWLYVAAAAAGAIASALSLLSECRKIAKGA